MKQPITITIRNWETFQPRKDRPTDLWFRVESGIMTSESLDELSPAQKWFWICLMAYACKKQTPTVTLNEKYFTKHSGVSIEEMQKALDHLATEGVISFAEIRDETAQGQVGGSVPPNGGLQTDRQTDRQTYSAPVAAPPATASVFDFEKSFEDFPIKVKGKEAEKRFHDQIKTPADLADFQNALANYNQMLAIEDWRHPKQSWAAYLGTKATGFFWRDYINWEAPKKRNGPALVPTKLDSDAERWATETVSVLKRWGRSGSNHLTDLPIDLIEELEIRWGSWAIVDVDTAAREIRALIFSYRKSHPNQTGVA